MMETVIPRWLMKADGIVYRLSLDSKIPKYYVRSKSKR